VSSPYRLKISRRATLQWFAAATALSSILPHALASTQNTAALPAAKGYGTDPDLNSPIVPWARTMTAHQLQVTAVLSDLILPGTVSAPPPSALGIPEFVDEWVSAPYPEQQADRTVIFEGLKWLDIEATRRWQRAFLQIDDVQRLQLIDAIVSETDHPYVTTQNTFFRRVRYLVVGAYYTTPEGFKDIGYIGNIPLPSYPPVTEQERSILDAELRQLGIA
jgi:hypothetical protein